ncbi:armadillo-type protein [Aspergillus aurantiobrunneus]
MAEGEEDFSSLPFPDRFSHKNWKARKGGYEDAKQQFEKTGDESDPIFAQFQDASLWKGAVTDSNVAAQQDGLAAYCAFLQFGGPTCCARTRGATVPGIAEKGLPQTRPAAKASALEALLLCVELDKPDPVIEEIIPVLSHKVPKVIAAGLAGLTAIYHNFGCKVVDPKPVLKALPKVFGHADKNVRAEAQNLTVELYRWLKEAMKPVFWADLKPVQQQDLEKLFEAVKQEPAPKQERLTRAQQAEADAGAGAGAGGETGEAGGEDDYAEDDGGEVDTFDLAEPVDVFPKIPKEFHEQLGSSKWKDRKDALDALYSALNVPKIRDGPFDEIVRGLAKCMKDANVAVVTVAANCVDLLAKGVRSGFVKYRPTIMSPIMERLKEKKQSVADALGQALDAVFTATSLSDCLEEILEFVKHKNPQVKQETVKFLIRCLRTTRSVPSKPEVKSIAEAATKLLTDSSEVNRAGGAEILGTLMKIMGERAMVPFLDGLDDIRKTKIKEYFDTAQVKAKDRPKPIVGAPKAAPAPPSAKKVTGTKKPLGLKKPAAAPAPPPEDPAPAPTPSKPATKSIPSKLSKPGGLPTPGGALKKKLGGPGGLASPQRRVVSPPSEEQPQQPPVSKFGLGRGLAGRPIAKPSAPSEPTPAPAAPAVSGLTGAEKAELEELRLEKERFARMVEDLKSDKTKLNSQVTELQNQNAQLIEDHTHDVLSIKAKETQIVRARSDAEAAEQNVQKQQREIERLKRELSRALRSSALNSPTTAPDQFGMPIPDASSIYQDPGSNGHGPIARSGLHMGPRFESARPRSYASASPSEEKENGLESPGVSRRKFSPTFGNTYSGIGSPTRSSNVRSGSVSGEDHQAARSGEPAENWKRAAEVTSQLKARIEQMKARQGLTRPPAQR